jgi:hypothetical protein
VLAVDVTLAAGENLLCRPRVCLGRSRDRLAGLDSDLALAPASSSSMSLDGGLDVLPDLVVYSFGSSVGDAVMSGGCALPIRTVHWLPVGSVFYYLSAQPNRLILSDVSTPVLA